MAPGKGKKKLAEQIHSLLSGPAPQEAFDPEAEDLERGGWAGRGDDDHSSDGGFAMEEEAVEQPAMRAKEKKFRMRADIAVDSKEYAGKAVPRRQLRGDEGDDDDDDEEDEVEHDDREDNESSQEEGESDSDKNDDDAVDEAVEIEQQQDAALLRMVAANKADSGKSMHARNQREISDSLLETRIRMQKPLQAAARLPRGSVLDTFCQLDEAASKAAAECCVEAAGLIQDLLLLKSELWKQNAALPNPDGWDEVSDWVGASGGAWKKRKRDAEKDCKGLWERVQRAEAAGTPFRDTTIDKWNSKVLMASGGGKNFKALNQSILQQTQQVMQDVTRLVRKTRVKRSTYKVIGEALHNTNSLPHKEAEGAGEEIDKEAYDDMDLYQLLLRDLIESGSSQGSDAVELQAQLRAARRKAGKMAKQVDTKASKGRKLRYDPQPKLVNFMFPVITPRPAFADALFENLFKSG